MVDNSDDQYATFMDNVPFLFIVMALHPLLGRLYDVVCGSVDGLPDTESTRSPNDRTPHLESEYNRAERRLKQRTSFDAGFSILFLIALHGFAAPKVLIILYINYKIATQLKKEYVPTATWIFNIGILFANELGKGYPYSNIARMVLSWSAPPDISAEKDSNSNWGTLLDTYGGLIPRWEILFNITVLRLISFNFDYYWSLYRSGGSPIEVRFPYNNILERGLILR